MPGPSKSSRGPSQPQHSNQRCTQGHRPNNAQGPKGSCKPGPKTGNQKCGQNLIQGNPQASKGGQGLKTGNKGNGPNPGHHRSRGGIQEKVNSGNKQRPNNGNQQQERHNQGPNHQQHLNCNGQKQHRPNSGPCQQQRLHNGQQQGPNNGPFQQQRPNIGQQQQRPNNWPFQEQRPNNGQQQQRPNNGQQQRLNNGQQQQRPNIGQQPQRPNNWPFHQQRPNNGQQQQRLNSGQQQQRPNNGQQQQRLNNGQQQQRPNNGQQQQRLNNGQQQQQRPNNGPFQQQRPNNGQQQQRPNNWPFQQQRPNNGQQQKRPNNEQQQQKPNNGPFQQQRPNNRPFQQQRPNNETFQQQRQNYGQQQRPNNQQQQQQRNNKGQHQQQRPNNEQQQRLNNGQQQRPNNGQQQQQRSNNGQNQQQRQNNGEHQQQRPNNGQHQLQLRENNWQQHQQSLIKGQQQQPRPRSGKQGLQQRPHVSSQGQQWPNSRNQKQPNRPNNGKQQQMSYFNMGCSFVNAYPMSAGNLGCVRATSNCSINQQDQSTLGIYVSPQGADEDLSKPGNSDVKLSTCRDSSSNLPDHNQFGPDYNRCFNLLPGHRPYDRMPRTSQSGHCQEERTVDEYVSRKDPRHHDSEQISFAYVKHEENAGNITMADTGNCYGNQTESLEELSGDDGACGDKYNRSEDLADSHENWEDFYNEADDYGEETWDDYDGNEEEILDDHDGNTEEIWDDHDGNTEEIWDDHDGSIEEITIDCDGNTCREEILVDYNQEDDLQECDEDHVEFEFFYDEHGENEVFDGERHSLSQIKKSCQSKMVSDVPGNMGTRMSEPDMKEETDASSHNSNLKSHLDLSHKNDELIVQVNALDLSGGNKLEIGKRSYRSIPVENVTCGIVGKDDVNLKPMECPSNNQSDEFIKEKEKQMMLNYQEDDRIKELERQKMEEWDQGQTLSVSSAKGHSVMSCGTEQRDRDEQIKERERQMMEDWVNGQQKPVTSSKTDVSIDQDMDPSHPLYQEQDASFHGDDSIHRFICTKLTKVGCQNDTCSFHHLSSGMPYLWQIKISRWISFTVGENEVVEKAFCALQEKAANEMVYVGKKYCYRVFFDKMKAAIENADGHIPIGGDQLFDVRRLTTPSFAEERSVASDYSTQWRWYWRNGQKFVTYERDIFQFTLEKKFITKQKSYLFYKDNGSVMFNIDFQRFTQTNMETGEVCQIIRRPIFVSMADVEHQKIPETIPYPVAMTTEKPNHFNSWDCAHDFELVSLDLCEREYGDVTWSFHETMDQKRFMIKHVYRIQNRKLWSQYATKRKHMLADTDDQDDQEHKLNERDLFHGTDSLNTCEGICMNNFDFRINGRNATLYGQGSYFATRAKLSNSYTKAALPTDLRYMFRAKVLVGKYTRGHPSYTRPPNFPDKCHKLYDSCVDNEDTPSIFVVFDRGQCYPEYLIMFTDSESSSINQSQVGTTEPSSNIPTDLGTELKSLVYPEAVTLDRNHGPLVYPHYPHADSSIVSLQEEVANTPRPLVYPHN